MYIFVYRMGRLCEGAHEISGIKATLFLGGGWLEGGGVGGGAVGGSGEGRRVGGWVTTRGTVQTNDPFFRQLLKFIKKGYDNK